MLRLIATVISLACLVILAFTDLSIEQRLLLLGVLLGQLVSDWPEFIDCFRRERE